MGFTGLAGITVIAIKISSLMTMGVNAIAGDASSHDKIGKGESPIYLSLIFLFITFFIDAKCCLSREAMVQQIEIMDTVIVGRIREILGCLLQLR